MERLITKKGNSLDCYRVLHGTATSVLMIYTNKLSPKEAFSFFEDPEDISELTIDTYHDITGEKQMSRIMRGYTSVHTIQKPLNIPDEKMLLIMLLRPTEKEEK